MATRAMGTAARCLLLPLAAMGLLRDGVYTVQNVNSGRYLNVLGGSKISGANVVIWANPGSPHTQWRLSQVGKTDTYTLQNVNSDLYLNAAGVQRGANAEAVSNGSRTAARWRVLQVANGDGTAYVVKNVASSFVLNVAGGRTDSGANVQLWDNPGSTHSQWEFLGLNCHDTTVGEMCYNDTHWAKDYAINTRPEWYPGLTNKSTLADFQAHLHHCYWKRCPLPCTLTGQHGCAMTARFWSNATCGDAIEGSKCYGEVKWAMTYGIQIYPTWYPELTQNSSFGEFQARLFKGQLTGLDGDHGCKEPCCHNAMPGELCHEEATWAMQYGINIPEFSRVYPPALTNASAFAEFQAYLHLCYPTRCPAPCASTVLQSQKDHLELNCPDGHNFV